MQYALHNHLGSKEDATAKPTAHGVWLATGGKNGRSRQESRLSASITGFCMYGHTIATQPELS
jgi:hypothetical protein